MDDNNIEKKIWEHQFFFLLLFALNYSIDFSFYSLFIILAATVYIPHPHIA